MDLGEIDFIKFCKSNPSSVLYFFRKACTELDYDISKVESDTACLSVWEKACQIWINSMKASSSIGVCR